jgi:F-type H+-transporting ATPase subunit epsilon
MLTIKIITPDETLFEGQAETVFLPGAKGRFQILDNHAPLVSNLAKGEIKLTSSGEEKTFDISGGVVEVLKNQVVVLV